MKKIREDAIRAAEEENRLMEEERARQRRESEEGGHILERVRNIEGNDPEVPFWKDTTVPNEGIGTASQQLEDDDDDDDDWRDLYTAVEDEQESNSDNDSVDDVFDARDDDTAENATDRYNVADYVAVDAERLEPSMDSGEKGTDENENASTTNKTPPRNAEDAKKMKRREQKRVSRQKALNRAREQLRGDRVAEMTWTPSRCVPITPVVGTQLSARWMCEKYIRAHTAHAGTQNGVNLLKSLESVSLKCRNKDCSASLSFRWQPKTGLWKLNVYNEHNKECFGEKGPVVGSLDTDRSNLCAPANSARQVARASTSS